MNKIDLGTWLAERVITEDNGIEKVIAIYPGRFQPMGQHHKKTYEWLSDQFGLQNTFIATSDKVEPDKSPFTFDEKKNIMQAHGIPGSQIVHVKNPYQSAEILSKFPEESTAVVFIYGKKDAGRIKYTKKDGTPGYFQLYEKGMEMESYTKHGYIVIAPHINIEIPGFGEMSGTSLRKALASAEADGFEDIMGFKDDNVYQLVKKVLSPDSIQSEQIERFIESYDIKPILMESSATAPGDQDVDDGPRYFYGNNKSYE